MSKLYLGFDAGTQSVKVSVYDENLKSITSQSLPTILRYPHAGWVEMDLDEFLEHRSYLSLSRILMILTAVTF